MPKSPIVYLELPSNDVAACKQFYHSLFEWSFQDFGPDYAAFSGSGLDGGLNGASLPKAAPNSRWQSSTPATSKRWRSESSLPAVASLCPSSPSPAAAASTSPTPLETSLL